MFELVEFQRTSRLPRVPFDVLFSRGVKRVGSDETVRPASSSLRRLAISVASQPQSVALKLRDVASVYGPSLAGRCKTPKNVLVGSFLNLRRTALANKSARMAERFARSSKLASSTVFRAASGKIGSVTRLSQAWLSVDRS